MIPADRRDEEKSKSIDFKPDVTGNDVILSMIPRQGNVQIRVKSTLLLNSYTPLPMGLIGGCLFVKIIYKMKSYAKRVIQRWGASPVVGAQSSIYSIVIFSFTLHKIYLLDSC